MVCVDIGGHIWTEGLEKNNERLKKIRNEPTTLERRTHCSPFDSPTPKPGG